MCLPALAAVPAAAAAAGGAAASAAAPTILGLSLPQALFGASLAISAATTGLNYLGQRQAADASNEYADAAIDAANDAFAADANAINRRTLEERDSDSRELTQARIETIHGQSRARASAAEGGVSGLSVDALLADYGRSYGFFRDGILTRQSNRELQSQRNIRSADARRRSRINSANSSRQAAPSILGTALRIGGVGLDAAIGYREATRAG